MQKFTRADQLPLPDTRTLGQRVHGFMDANPDLGQNPNVGLPSRRMNRLFQQLMQYYGTMDPTSGEYFNGDSISPADADALYDIGKALNPDDPDLAYRFAEEPFSNELDKVMFNYDYDSQQPYGFDFSYGPQSFDVDHENNVTWQNDIDGSYPHSMTPENSGFLDNAKNALVPIAKTAGSMALPMLFSALLRGGK